MRRLCLAVFAMFFLVLGIFTSQSIGQEQDNEPTASVVATFKRDFGYFIGDLVAVSYEITLSPANLVLNEGILPAKNGQVVSWLEVKERFVRREIDSKRVKYRINYIYQIFWVMPETAAIEIPAIPFFYGLKENPNRYSGQLPALSLTVAALTVKDSKFKPVIFYRQENLTAFFVKIIGISLLVGGLICLWIFSRKRLVAYSPFKSALIQLGLWTHKDGRKAIALFHEALNQKAGRAVFRNTLEEFFRKFPLALAHKKDIADLFEISYKLSFEGLNKTGFEEDLFEKVESILKKLRRCEKWR